MRDRIKGMLIGIMVGDALGMPVETFSAERISETYGRITDYHIPSGHKWFDGEEAGTYTDDCQLTIAVAKGLIEKPLDMDTQVKYHVEALKETTKGWGTSTRNSVRRVANGAHWSVSAEPPTELGRGVGAGNGVPMKIAPVGAYIWANQDNPKVIEAAFKFIADLSQMTHGTSISVSAGLSHAFAIFRCLSFEKGNFKVKHFSRTVQMASVLGMNYLPDTIIDDISERLANLWNNIEDYDTTRIIEEFGGGSCYCYNSLPFTYAFFLKNPNSIDSLYDCVSAGGDADSNGSMLGGLLGALNGSEIFPEHLIKGLKNPEVVTDLADQLCDSLGID